MKKLYTLGMALAMVAFGTQSFAQVKQLNSKAPNVPFTSEMTSSSKIKATKGLEKGGGPEVYWSEDFSNGFDGQGSNGAWSVSEDLGSLWFWTFPVGATDGYDPDAAILGGASADYETKIPNYFGTRDVVGSETRDNGVMMLDADRYNSTSTVEEPDGGLTENVITSSLVSPPMDLTAVTGGAVLTFNQYLRVCCSGYGASADITVDGGATWLPFDAFTPYGEANQNIDVQASFDITDILAGAADLSAVQVRFFWNGSQSHYFWSLDDVKITALPDNDLVAGETFTNNYYQQENTVFAADNPTPATDYFGAFEYYDQPEYYTRPYNFAMEVTNAGGLLQENVVLTVTATSPGGAITTFDSDPIDLESGVMDTITISSVLLSQIADPIETGQYIFDFSVASSATDDTPGNNVGDSRQSTVSSESDNNEFAIMRNDVNDYTGAYTTLGQDVIWATSYEFPELQAGNSPKYITHVEAVFLFSADFAETIAGELVYFNVRKNHPFEEDEAIPETAAIALFGSDNLAYDDQELEFTIQESDIWNSDDGLPFVWASFLLPTPVLIEPDVVYQAEFRVPAAGGAIVFPPVTGDSEIYSSLVYDFADGAWSWLGSAAENTGNAMPIRFRTATVDNLEDVSYESGLTLIQNYPNPMTDVTRIQYSVEESTTATLEVRDITGKLVFTKGLGTLSANVPQTYELQRGDLAPGVYTYSLVTPEFQVSRKLTVQ